MYWTTERMLTTAVIGAAVFLLLATGVNYLKGVIYGKEKTKHKSSTRTDCKYQ